MEEEEINAVEPHPRGLSAASRRARDAQARGRHGLEPCFSDRAAALLAETVRVVVDLAEGVLDVVQRVAQRAGQRRDLAPLGGHLSRIGEPFVEARPIETSGQLAKAVEQAVGRRASSKTHPATRTFQALRIAANTELDALAAALPQAHGLLGFGARIAVLSYHSLEDRIVKDYFRQESRDCICPPGLPECRCGHKATLRLITRGAMKPSPSEIAANPRSRSAKLRVAERIAAVAA